MSVLHASQDLTISESTVNSVSGNQTNITNVNNFIVTSDSANYLAAMNATPSGDTRRGPMLSGKMTLPRLSTMFTGRQDILKQLAHCLNPEISSITLKKQRIFVLYGLGGAGKTQIMAKFVDEFVDQFFGVYCIDASTLETIRAGFENIARNISMGNTVDDALHWFAQEAKDWLLVIDNADDPKIDLSPYLPRCRHGNVIITTRNPDCRRYAPDSNCNVSGMTSDDDGIELLLKCSMVEDSERNRKLCGSICEEFGYHALAIAQAGAYISQCCPIDEYLQIYHEDRSQLLQEHPLQTSDDYQQTVYTTWEMSVKKLSSTAAGFLQLCGFMHHGGISKTIFQKAATAGYMRDAFKEGNNFLNNFKSDNGKWSNIKFLNAIKELASYSLISIDNKHHVFSIHPLVHTWSRYRTSTAEQNETRSCVLQILALAINKDYSAEGFAFRRSLLPHIDESRTEMMDADIGDKLQKVYSEGKRLKAAEEMQKPVMETRIRVLGIDHLDTLSSMGNLANTYSDQGRWKEAEELFMQVLDVYTRLLGVDHPHTLYCMNSLGNVYCGQGRWKEAEERFLPVMDLKKRLLGDKHPDTLLIMGNIACTYSKQGREKEAEELFLQVINSNKTLLGVDHPDTLTSLHNFACIHKFQGRWKEAEKFQLQVMDSMKRLLGVDHPDTLLSMDSLAQTYVNQGRWKEAEDLFLQVLNLNEMLLGVDHPYMLNIMSSLAQTYVNQGRWKEAEDLFLQVLNLNEMRLGIDHQDTLNVMSNLACTYSYQGHKKKAEELFLRVMDVRKRLLGIDHPDTLDAMSYLAYVIRCQGRLKEAEDLDLQVVQVKERLVVDGH